ncbi:MAG: hypothetical protein R3A11_07045 [Bdellovibrionota bacterium]
MKKHLWAVALLVGLSGVANAQDWNGKNLYEQGINPRNYEFEGSQTNDGYSRSARSSTSSSGIIVSGAADVQLSWNHESTMYDLDESSGKITTVGGVRYCRYTYSAEVEERYTEDHWKRAGQIDYQSSQQPKSIYVYYSSHLCQN